MVRKSKRRKNPSKSDDDVASCSKITRKNKTANNEIVYSSNDTLPQIYSPAKQTPSVVHSVDEPIVQSSLLPYTQPVLPNFIINIQPQNQTPIASETQQANEPCREVLKPKKRGRKPKAVVEAEVAAAVRTDVCSIQYNCEKNHPNHHLDGNLDTYPVESIVEYANTQIPKNEVRN